MDPKVFFVVDKLQVGDISSPVQFQTMDGKDAYRILFLKGNFLVMSKVHSAVQVRVESDLRSKQMGARYFLMKSVSFR